MSVSEIIRNAAEQTLRSIDTPEDDEVQTVLGNFEIPDEVMASLA